MAPSPMDLRAQVLQDSDDGMAADALAAKYRLSRPTRSRQAGGRWASTTSFLLDSAR